MRFVLPIVVSAAFIFVGACGKPLGDYQVTNAKVVAASEEPNGISDRFDTQLLRVEFISKTDLYEASDGGHEGLYVMASYCPYDEDRTLYFGEPYYNDQSRYGPARVLERNVLPDGRITERIEGNDRRPAKNPRTDDYIYTTYIALERAGEPERPGRPAQIAYNLRLRPQDLCLRIDHPGYFITPSRSEVFILPTAMIRRAVLTERAQR